MTVREEFEAVQREALEAADGITDVRELEEREIEFLGRKGRLAEVMMRLKEVDPTERPAFGALANKIKHHIEEAYAARRSVIEAEALERIAETEALDVTEPGHAPPVGTLHPTTQSIHEIVSIFEPLGFTRERYPEIDWDWFAFEALNMPQTHPARDEWETFFVDAPHHAKFGKMVLTPHTSNGQIHEMTHRKPPIRMINIAKCYRRQSDITHTPMFHQFEGLVVDRGISVAHLKGTLDYFARQWFGPERKIRLRPFHFRFTEPSFEIDVSCGICLGTGRTPGGACRVCKEGWLELGGAGMVHPNVFKTCGVGKNFTGFAFGWGVERVFMMRSGMHIRDLRDFYKNDVRFLKQF